MRRRIRLRTTAFPTAFFTLAPKRLRGPTVRAIENDELPGRAPPATAIDRFEVDTAQQTPGPGKPLRRARGAFRWA